VVLAPGETYTAPTVVATYANAGMNGVSDRLHTWLRARPTHPTSIAPRPLTLNVWEAVYMNHDLEKLTALLDVAVEIGVERFVLDDGWFGDRRHDRAGLGDWVVSPEAWPTGLEPLISRVKAAGLQFGLWFEGEMVNPDSELFRAHPDWILHIPGRVPPEGRHQHVLDITHEDAYAHVLTQVDAILTEYAIDYIKWDHNKVLVDPGHHGAAAVHAQTTKLYELFDELKRRHPGLEIESCSSGGGRVDLGMAQHADRFWTSDCNDALERQYIQRHSQIAIPPEMLGSHIGPTHSHTTGRTHSLSFRAVTALFGHAGLEWNITETTAEERVHLARWAEFYKQHRALLHSGKVTVVDHSDPAAFVHGVVAQDATEAIFAYVQLAASAGSVPDAALLPGLDADALYRVTLVEPAGPASTQQLRAPAWVDGVTLTGGALGSVGVRPPLLWPEQAVLLHAVRV
jgi:alpha-galactosidase